MPTMPSVTKPERRRASGAERSGVELSGAETAGGGGVMADHRTRKV
ncbi:hypothetical protein KCH_73960 [Kitasatospora cheerisanensis KCTC 2395]|uniref:Uncharacterized protein n=1 Tax=Kitasatospora cheerisanensis KCTC 2395 TaxID=1348663 RepID=A0A066YS33_9ACTN|nr:hypothetical protein KCH_73960 [Kitasatospora cheerisanensis KCTC 2395]